MQAVTGLLAPAPRPCESCPYRTDVPSGVWSYDEYEKLRQYDVEQFAAPFQCHQTDAVSDRSRYCGGWSELHADRNIAMRMRAAKGDDAAVAAMGYRSPVDLFGSGEEAADHGQDDIDDPSVEAQALIAKISRVRNFAGQP